MTITIIIIIIMCKLQSSSSMKNHELVSEESELWFFQKHCSCRRSVTLVSEESELCFFPVEPLQLLPSSALSCPHRHWIEGKTPKQKEKAFDLSWIPTYYLHEEAAKHLMKENTKAKQNPTGWALWRACVFVYLICRNGLSLLLLLCFVVDKNGRAECTPSYLLHDFILLHPRFHCSSRSLPPNPDSLATDTVIYVMNFFFRLLCWRPKTSSPWMGGWVLSSSGPSSSAATLQLCSSSWVHTRHTSLQEDPTRYYPKEKKHEICNKLQARWSHNPHPKNQNPQRLNPMQNPKHFCCSRKKKFVARDHHHTFPSNTTGPRKKQKQ